MLGYIESAQAEGARIVMGGGVPAHLLDTGYYVEPTLIADVDDSMTVAQQEIFGPVLIVDPVRGRRRRCAYRQRHHLRALRHDHLRRPRTRDLAVARRIRTGTLSVNGVGGYLRDLPFGGYKQSGIGRQWGPEGFDEMMEYTAFSAPA